MEPSTPAATVSVLKDELQSAKMKRATSELETDRKMLAEFKVELSQLRKRGADTMIAELIFLGIPAKIKMAEVAFEQKELDKIDAAIERLNDEISESKNSLERELEQVRAEAAAAMPATAPSQNAPSQNPK